MSPKPALKWAKPVLKTQSGTSKLKNKIKKIKAGTSLPKLALKKGSRGAVLEAMLTHACMPEHSNQRIWMKLGWGQDGIGMELGSVQDKLVGGHKQTSTSV